MAASSQSSPRTAALIVEVGGQRRRVPVSKPVLTIGRLDDSDIVIPDFRVSRLHARITTDNGSYFIEDAGSRHGTFVNGEPADHVRLKDGDQIVLGAADLKLTFSDRPQAASSATILMNRFVESDQSELEKLRLFLEAARSLSGHAVLNDVLRTMMDYALRLTKAERGFVYLKDSSGRPSLACGVDHKGDELTADANVSHSVVEEALSSAAEFITGDATQQSGLASRESIVLNELRTIAAIPLRPKRVGAAPQADPQVEGVLYLDSRFASRNLTGIGSEVLRALASECAAVLESARLMQAEQAAQQYRQEMEIAAAIQRSLVSESNLQTDFAQVRASSIPCREVGGDFFDVLAAPDRVTVMVADVSGKGISAALLASVIHGMFYAQISSGASLVESISAINSFLCSRVAGRKYATLIAAQLSAGGQLDLVNCGHVPALIAEQGQISVVTDGDMPLGLLPAASFHSISLKLGPRGRLCLLTDGLTETEDGQGKEMGLEGVQGFLSGSEPVAAVMQAVLDFSDGREAQDDRTVLVLERTT